MTGKSTDKAKHAASSEPFDLSQLGAPKIFAFQGSLGAYSHQAGLTVLPAFEGKPYQTFQQAMDSVQAGEVSVAVIPIENSLGGRVAGVHQLLPESRLYFVGEVLLPIQHQLMALPGTSVSDLTEVHSHEQALAQCRKQLDHLKVKSVVAADTAGSAKWIAETGLEGVGALASRLAASIYGLTVLRESMEDRTDNVTRFVLMSRRRIEPDPDGQPAVTSFLFRTRSVPAALFKSLGGFATNGVNFTKLESYLSVTDPNSALFFAEVEGHPAQPPVMRALDELHYYTDSVRILGVFPKNRDLP